MNDSSLPPRRRRWWWLLAAACFVGVLLLDLGFRLGPERPAARLDIGTGLRREGSPLRRSRRRLQLTTA